jgi:hypothetical protein
LVGTTAINHERNWRPGSETESNKFQPKTNELNVKWRKLLEKLHNVLFAQYCSVIKSRRMNGQCI